MARKKNVERFIKDVLKEIEGKKYSHLKSHQKILSKDVDQGKRKNAILKRIIKDTQAKKFPMSEPY